MPKSRPVGNVDLEQLASWIKRRPELKDLCKLADNAKVDYRPGGNSLRERLIISTDRQLDYKSGSALANFASLIWVPGKSLRGKSYATPSLDKTLNASAKMMSISTLWDFFCTLPLLKFGLSTPLAAFSWPAALILSFIILFASNIAGEKSTDRHDKNHSTTATLGLAAFLLLSLIKTAFSGVGIDLFIGSRGVASNYAQDLVSNKLSADKDELKRLQEPAPSQKLATEECLTLEKRLELINRNSDERSWVSAYVLAYGTNVEKLANQSLSTQQMIEKYGSISKIPGACNRKRLLQDISREREKTFRDSLDQKIKLSNELPALEYLKKHESSIYYEHFRDTENGLDWVNGTTAVAQATDQFWRQVFNGDFGKLGFSLFFLFVSIVLTSAATLMLYQVSVNQSVKASFSQNVMDSRDQRFEVYRKMLSVRKEGVN